MSEARRTGGNSAADARGDDAIRSSLSRWELPNVAARLELTAEGQAGAFCLEEARSALMLACNNTAAPRLIEVKHRPDLQLIAGTAEWAEGFIREKRQGGDPTLIVALDVSPENASVARILEAGGDDCLGYPFETQELRARVHAVLRRVGPFAARCPEVALDHGALRIRVHGVEARVSRKQFEVFACLAEHRERWVHSNDIIAAVSGTHHEATTSLVRVHIHGLRKVLGGVRDCIRCDGRRSYMLTLALPRSPAEPSLSDVSKVPKPEGPRIQWIG